MPESWSCSASDWPRPKRLFCWTCAVKMNVSIDEKPAPIWNVPRRSLGDLEVDDDAVGGRAFLFRDVDALEVAERRHARLAALDLGHVVELALDDL